MQHMEARCFKRLARGHYDGGGEAVGIVTHLVLRVPVSLGNQGLPEF